MAGLPQTRTRLDLSDTGAEPGDCSQSNPMPTAPTDSVGQAVGQKTGVGTSTTEIVPANSSRVGLIITNHGDKDAWIAFDVAAEKEKGIRLEKKKGQGVFDSALLSKGALNGLADSGTTDFSWQEFNPS